MPTKIVFSPPMPKDIMDECRAMVPQGYELAVVERGVGGGIEAHPDAEYFIGFARGDMGPDFYKTLPKLKLVQLISAGYDRLDVAAAKQAGVPVANNGGSNSVAVAEHWLSLGVPQRWRQHNNWWRGSGASATCREPPLHGGQDDGDRGRGTSQEVARRAHGSTCGDYTSTVRLTGSETRSRALRAHRRAAAPRRGEHARALTPAQEPLERAAVRAHEAVGGTHLPAGARWCEAR